MAQKQSRSSNSLHTTRPFGWHSHLTLVYVRSSSQVADTKFHNVNVICRSLERSAGNYETKYTIQSLTCGRAIKYLHTEALSIQISAQPTITCGSIAFRAYRLHNRIALTVYICIYLVSVTGRWKISWEHDCYASCRLTRSLTMTFSFRCANIQCILEWSGWTITSRIRIFIACQNSIFIACANRSAIFRVCFITLTSWYYELYKQLPTMKMC